MSEAEEQIIDESATNDEIESEQKELPDETNIEKHKKRQKESLLKAIGSTFWLWIEELTKTISSESKKETSTHSTKHQITPELEKEESAVIKRRWIHEE